MNEIVLKIPKTLTGLAGNKYGRKIYDEQVAQYIDDFNNIVIVFPDNVTEIATSFLQGFFKTPVEKIGIEGVYKNFKFKSKIEDLENIINTAILTMR